MEWNSMNKLIKSLREGVQHQTEATMMKDDGEVVHNCAKHVEHVTWGKGATISEEHAAPDESGNIAWYDVVFEHGVERQVPTADLNILVAETHKHAVKKAVKEASEPKTEKEKKLAALGHPKDKITHKDVLIGRGVLAKEEVEELDELSKKTLANYSQQAAHDVGNKMFNAGHDYGTANAARMLSDKPKLAAAFEKDAAKKHSKALTRLQGIKTAAKKLGEEVEDVDQTISYKPIDVEIKESAEYADYFKAALTAIGAESIEGLSEEERKEFFALVDECFSSQDDILFVEAWMRGDVQDKMDMHKKAGNKVSDAVHTNKSGQSYHSFVVTEPSGKRTRHIYHGNSRKLETMSPAPKSNLAHEAGEDDEDDK